MADIIPLSSAIADLVHDGDIVAMEGFTHLIPHAAGHEIIRQGKKNLTLVRMTPDLIYDQLIGMGCARKLIFSWGGNPGVGSLHRFRDAIENAWPQALEIEEHSHADMACAYDAGAAGLPMAILRAHRGTDLPKFNPTIREIVCPFTGEILVAVPSLRPDVAVIHAQQSDRRGNVLIWGISGVQKEAVLAAKRAIVTVEEIVDSVAPRANSVILPHWTVSAVCHEPGGAFPSYALGYSTRGNDFYRKWDAIARDRESFASWMQRYVLDVKTFAEHRALLTRSAHG